MNWWRDYFDAKYIDLLGQQFSRGAQQTHADVELLLKLLPPAPARILDAGCGQGRHSIRLAQAGYQMTGIEQSRSLIERARQAATAAKATVEFVEGEHLTCQWEATFDAIINMSTAFGYYADDTDNQRVLEAWHRALHENGFLIMELGHRDQIVRNFRSNYWYALENKTILRVRRTFDAIRGVNIVEEFWRTAEGEEGQRYHSIHLYNATQLANMLQAACFTPIAWYGDLDLRPFTHEARQLIVVAQKQQNH
jgi:SAM-dependent methyltransferase